MKEQDRVKRLVGSLILAGGTVFAAHVCGKDSKAELPPAPKPTIAATIEVKSTPTARLAEIVRSTPVPLYIDFKTGSPEPRYK